jgi:hypothetical protein
MCVARLSFVAFRVSRLAFRVARLSFVAFHISRFVFCRISRCALVVSAQRELHLQLGALILALAIKMEAEQGGSGLESVVAEREPK